MRLKYKMVFIISALLISLSVSMSVVNYVVALKNTKKQLQERSLPLTVDNIYTEIQKHIIEPNLVASMMAHDTFLKDWLIHEEEDVVKISKYLETIKNKYNMFTTFLVSQNTKNYYTEEGLVEEIKKENKQNEWYFAFQKSQGDHEINLDFNDYIDESLIMFINHKIFDEDYHFIGATGIGLKISYINDMLKKFRQNYHFSVVFLDKNANVVLYERDRHNIKSLKDIPELYSLKDKLISKKCNVLENDYNGEKYLINTKYIPELDLYLIVEAKTSYFTKILKETFYFNLIISLLITILIIFFIISLVKKYNKKLEFLASHDVLTKLSNRHTFDIQFEKFFLLSKRNSIPLSLVFMDIDNFKKINDEFGHIVGDKVLKRIAMIITYNVRKTDLVARWGGEEFIIAFIDSSIEDSKSIVEKIRKNIEEDELLYKLVKYKVTASFGLTSLRKDDSIQDMLPRSDEAMYMAKESGKNTIIST